MKKKHSCIKTYKTWNNVPNKPSIADCRAKEGDIVMKIHNVWFLCQRENDVNNIVCFRQYDKFVSNMESIRAMFEFCYRLRLRYGIKYIRISGSPGRYNFIDKLFPNQCVKANNGAINEYGEIVRYIHLDDNLMIRLRNLRVRNGK